MTHRRFRPINPAFVGLWLALAVASGVHAAPLRLSLDAQSVVPAAEAGQAPPAPVADDDRQPGDDLSFVAAPDLAFPDLADAAAADADWLVAARAQQDDVAAADRHLGDFAPQVPPPLVPSVDPIDDVKIAASSPPSASAAQPALLDAVVVPDRSGLVWLVLPPLGLALGLAWWADRRGGSRRRHRSPAAR